MSDVSIVNNKFHCSCGENVPVRFKDSVAAACPKCHTLTVFEGNTKHRIKKEYFIQGRPKLNLGQQGVFDGISYTITGYTAFKEQSVQHTTWFEFVLRDADGNYKILSDDSSHFNLFDLAPLEEGKLRSISYTNKKPHAIKYNLEEYSLYEKYHTDWLFSEGEFPYDPTEESYCREYVRGAEVIVGQQWKDGSEEFYFGVYQNRFDMKKAFGKTFNWPSSIHGNRVPWKKMNWKSVTIVWLCFIIASSLLSIIKDYAYPETVLVEQNFDCIELSDSSLQSSSFHIEGPALLELTMNSPGIQESWLENYVSLVNDETNSSYNMGIYTSFYSGFEDGYHWTEDSRTAKAYLNQIPDGNYHLRYEFVKGSPNMNCRVQMQLVQSPNIWKNFWTFFWISLIFPAIIIIVEMVYASWRYENSDMYESSN